MPHISSTVEDQLLLNAIQEECPWEYLPRRLQATLSSKEEWHRRIVGHCIKKRLQWKTCFAHKVIKEGEYYEEMMRYLRKNLALFPYHLAEYVCRVMRVSAFSYYCDMIFEVMKNEQPYDSIPNFSAADALRLTGIGRNEFIDIMNKCRSKKIMWKLNKSIAKEFLPTQPVDFVIEPWWVVCLVNFTLEEFKKLSEEENATIDKVCKEAENSFIQFDPDIVKGLYQRGFIYFDVPVYPDDRFKVSRLEGFVSNREQSYEDPIEELLYAVFVVSSENSTVAELAATLQADLSQLQAAASFSCRLGWAVKLIDPASILYEPSTSGVPSINLSDEEDGSRASLSSWNMSIEGSTIQQGDISRTENYGPASGYTRIAFVVDANITSYLMMGSVSPGLKSHAVTLYEAGKLGHACIEDLCKDLSTLEGTKFEGELQQFANHAFSLRCVLECLTSGGVPADERNVEAHEKMCTISNEEATSLIAGITLTDKSQHSDTDEVILNCDDSMHSGKVEDEILAEPSTGSTDNVRVSANMSKEANCPNEDSKSDSCLQNDDKGLFTEVLDDETGPSQGKKKCHVDILRCESLAALSPATLDKLFLHNYDIVISMVPLPLSAILPGPKGPIHFGPPCHSSMTPWMKLVMYSAVASGPLAVVLMKGQCLRMLPEPLAGCEKALIWSWDGATVGGSGGKFEGNIITGSRLLHCLNSLLKYSAVLVHPLDRNDLDECGRIMTMDIPLPLKNSDGTIVDISNELGLCTEESSKLNSLLSELANKIEPWTIGYIRLLKLFKETDSDPFLPDDKKYEWVPLSLEFGIPLFSPKLCNDICKRVVASELLQTDLCTEHHDAMHDLRTKLHDICAEYQATGPTARLLYQRDQSRDSSRHLMNYASGTWDPLVDSPISRSLSGHQRLKLAKRQRCKTEVLSFDGNILRSYALTPVYEAATRPIEEYPPVSNRKIESEDADSREVILPGVNLLFDGSELRPFDIGACLQARQPVTLIAEASAASSAIK